MDLSKRFKSKMVKTTTKSITVELSEDEILSLLREAIARSMKTEFLPSEIKLCFEGEAHYGFSLNCTATMSTTEEIVENYDGES